MRQDARKLHELAEQAREAGDFLEALQLTDQATIAYQEEGDLLGLAEVQSSRFITFKHLFQKTEEKNYLVLALHSALSSVEIAESSGQDEALSIPYLNLGEAYAQLEDWGKAVDAYKKAIKYFEEAPSALHNRPAVLLNIKNHLYVAEYKAGDKTALGRAEATIPELEVAEENSYNKNAWLSGAHNRIAEMIYKENEEKAQEHLLKAKEIIDSDERLVLRKEQWVKLNALITS